MDWHRTLEPVDSSGEKSSKYVHKFWHTQMDINAWIEGDLFSTRKIKH